ncbi:integrase core domain-containing protein, partial [Aromatoleum toluolicum]|uniref:integrase core domain-containing protein n=1 Tax=Aromatoleum toluolicum TaxID=90060 RepID=UPI001FEB28ED
PHRRLAELSRIDPLRYPRFHFTFLHEALELHFMASVLWGQAHVSIRYSERLAEAGIEPSVGSKGDSYDNALAETINGLYKAEMIHRRAPWKTKESVELATLEWVSWFNHHRLLEPIGYIPPAEAEANYYGQLARQAAIAA